MTLTETGKGGPDRPVRENPGGATREIAVWDPLVRLVHWSLVLCIVLNSFVLEDNVWHDWVGYVAVALVGLRVLWGLIGPKHARFTAFPPNPFAAVAHLRGLLRGRREVHLSHNPAGALMAYNIWATVLALGATGYMMGTVRFFGMEWVEEAHEAFFTWLMVSVGLHLAGVVFDSWRSGVPLVRAMVTGRKKVPEGAETR